MAKKRAPLPKTFLGATVVRGRGLGMKAFNKLEDEKALDVWVAGKPVYVVVDDSMNQSFGDIHAFTSKADALRYAQACANGNCDQRVLTVTAQTLVVATENDL